MNDRFDFEQQINECWRLVDEIKFINDNLVKNGTASKEQVSQVLEGMTLVYNAKFEQLWETFEHLVEIGKIK